MNTAWLMMLLVDTPTTASVDLRNGLPTWGTHEVERFYYIDALGERLPTHGTAWHWELDSVAWHREGEDAHTVWHHSAERTPAQGGAFSVYEVGKQCISFHRLNGDTLVEDSTWVLTQGYTDIWFPTIPYCWQGQALDDTLWYYDGNAGLRRFTTFRARLDLQLPWARVENLLVFEDRILDHIRYRIHRKEDLVRELARYHVQDGMYLRWP